MAKPLNADWPLAQALYVQGVPYKAIAEKVSVTEAALRQRARRYRWRELRTAALQTVSQAVTHSPPKTLVQRAHEVRSSLGEDLSETVEALRQTPIKPGLDHLDERAEVAGKLAGTASRVFGWEEEKPVGLVVAGMIPEPGEGPDSGRRERVMAAATTLPVTPLHTQGQKQTLGVLVSVVTENRADTREDNRRNGDRGDSFFTGAK